jgi:hypothetical protein
LNKLETVMQKEVKEMSSKERWAVYFKYHEDREKQGIIKAILEQEEGIQMAQEAYSKITQDEHERSRLMSEWKFEMDFQSKMVSAERAFKRERAEKEQAWAEKERERAEKERALVQAERDRVQAERDRVQAERDRERAERAEREQERMAKELAELRRQVKGTDE